MADGGWNIEHIGLHRSRPEAFGVGLLLDCDRHILVPANLPVRVRNLVKKNAPDRKVIGLENWLNQSSDCRRGLNWEDAFDDDETVSFYFQFNYRL